MWALSTGLLLIIHDIDINAETQGCRGQAGWCCIRSRDTRMLQAPKLWLRLQMIVKFLWRKHQRWYIWITIYMMFVRRKCCEANNWPLICQTEMSSCLQANLAFLIAVILPPAIWIDGSWLTMMSRHQMEISDAKVSLLFLVLIHLLQCDHSERWKPPVD